ncbi:MAG: DUF4395 domain-containing protein [Anaeromyxobacteraceae bacterium]
MTSIVKFGEDVPGYRIPVLNEREIRAAAGLLFVLMFAAIAGAVTRGSFVLLKYAIAIFLLDMLIRVLVSPRYAPTLVLGRLIVRNQVPEYVGARQKRFAWVIGVALASVMFLLVNVLNTYSPISGIICLVCLVFLFCETAFGICIGCKVYGLVTGEKAEHCPGEVCEPGARQEIQRTTPAQLLMVVGLVAYVVLVGMLFHSRFAEPARPLFGG